MLISKIIFLIIANIIFFPYPVSAKVPEIVMSQVNSVATLYVYERGVRVSSATCFVVDSSGILATNNHVIAEASRETTFLVKFKNSDLLSVDEIIYKDESNDLALLKITKKGLKPVVITPSSKYIPGDDVIVIGSPLGLDLTVSNGIVSGLRSDQNLIQITAPISPGSSGSPVFNTSGQVIGVVTMLATAGQNVNFAVPIKYVTSLLAKSKTSYQSIKNSIARSKYEGTLAQDGSAIVKVNELLKAVESEPNNPTIWHSLGMLYISLFRYKDAAKSLDIALKYDPNNSTIQSARGYVDFKLGRINRAVTRIEGVLINNNNHLPSLYYLGQIYSSQNNKLDYAIVLWNRYLAIESDGPIAVDIIKRMNDIKSRGVMYGN